MKRFLCVQKLALTPLSPIHVGCGEDFVPTNYVIDGDVLYSFDPAGIDWPPQDRKALREAVAAGGVESIRRVQRFFSDRREVCAAASHRAVMVAPGVAVQHETRAGRVAQHEQGGQRVVNVLEIERTAHHPHTGVPYLPGSAIKGAMRTAWLDQLNGGAGRQRDERAQALEKRLLEGQFETDPFRLLRLGDASGEAVWSRVLFATNHKKREVLDKDGKPRTAQGPAVRRECIEPGQYRALHAEVRFDNLGGMQDGPQVPAPARRIDGWETLAGKCNDFYRRRLRQDLDLFARRRFVSDDWLRSMKGLLDALAPAFDTGRMMLLRVGRHSGAESLTLEGVRAIRIMGTRGEPSKTEPASTTVWLAAEQENARSGMEPFGWLLVEPEDAPEIPRLRQWCEARPLAPHADLARKLDAARAKMEVDRAERLRHEDDVRRAEEAARFEAVREAERLAALSPQGKVIEGLRASLARHYGRKQNVGGALYAQIQNLIKQADGSEWTLADKHMLAEVIAGLGYEKIDFGGREKDVRKTIARLREAS